MFAQPALTFSHALVEFQLLAGESGLFGRHICRARIRNLGGRFARRTSGQHAQAGGVGSALLIQGTHPFLRAGRGIGRRSSCRMRSALFLQGTLLHIECGSSGRGCSNGRMGGTFFLQSALFRIEHVDPGGRCGHRGMGGPLFLQGAGFFLLP
ncbi:MAG: hypothetical protein EBU07_16125, partial [Betaproteobacteria bacterium]|nr:hypothetical protein [Betaproteobacteria bacterium]